MGIVSYTIFIFPNILKSFMKPSLYSIAIVFAWLVSSVLVVILFYVFCDLHVFCYELYNAIQESGLTVKEFVEMIQ